jgi:hypothetical protein
MARKNKSRKLFPVLLVVFGASLILGSIAWIVWAGRAESTPAPEPTLAGQRIPYPDVPRVSVGDAKAAFELGNAIFLDPRGEPYYSQGHIPGALAISEEELEARLGELDPESWIITYCT